MIQQLILIVGVIALGIWALFKLQKNFSMRLFYLIGVWLMLIQAISSTYGLFVDWGFLPIWAKISKIGGISFSYLLTYLFYYLFKTAPASQGGAGTQLSPEEINKFLEDEGGEK